MPAAQRVQYSATQRVLMILWPAFVMAGVLEMMVFAVVDPGSLTWFGAAPIEGSPSTVYSVTFLIFWAVIATAAGMTKLLEEPEVRSSRRSDLSEAHRADADIG